MKVTKDVQLARYNLLVCQYGLAAARLTRKTGLTILAYEMRVCEALDLVWAAQQRDLAGINVGDVITGAGIKRALVVASTVGNS